MEVTVKINTETAAGRKAVRDLQNKKYAHVEYTLHPSLAGQSYITLDEMIESIWDKLSEHYQVDMRKL